MSFLRADYARRLNAAPKDSSAGSVVLSFVASTALGGHRLVRSLAGELVYADQDTLADANAVLGLTLNAASAGSEILVQTSGIVTEASWAWTPDLPLFAGNLGILTQTPPADGFSLIVGIALTATSIHLGIKMPIIQGS